MVELDQKHEEYNVAMELLCTLPHENVYHAQLDTLCEDLGTNHQSVMDLLDILRSNGFLADSRTDRDSGEVFVFISEFDWNKCKIACNRYWKKVYGKC